MEEPEHKEASEDEDVMEAVARSRRRDAGLEAPAAAQAEQ